MYECPECPIRFNGMMYSCTEKLYLSEKASDMEYPEIADEIRAAKHGGAAKAISKRLPKDRSEQWDMQKGHQVMSLAIDAKIRACSHFREALIESGDKILAEATYHPLFASGLPPDVTAYTKPDHFPGKNLLGAILMEEREKLINEPLKEWPDENCPLSSNNARDNLSYVDLLNASNSSQETTMVNTEENPRLGDPSESEMMSQPETPQDSVIEVNDISFPSLSTASKQQKDTKEMHRGRPKARVTRRTHSLSPHANQQTMKEFLNKRSSTPKRKAEEAISPISQQEKVVKTSTPERTEHHQDVLSDSLADKLSEPFSHGDITEDKPP